MLGLMVLGLGYLQLRPRNTVPFISNYHTLCWALAAPRIAQHAWSLQAQAWNPQPEAFHSTVLACRCAVSELGLVVNRLPFACVKFEPSSARTLK